MCIFVMLFAGREERYFDRFHVSPDGKHLIFLGTNGYLILLSSKVGNQGYNPLNVKLCNAVGIISLLFYKMFFRRLTCQYYRKYYK